MAGEFSVIAGSILDLDPTPDAIVSSDDNHLSHGGGVARAIWTRAGDELAAEVSVAAPRLSLGDVLVTGGYGTGSRNILHAISIDFDLYRRLDSADVRPLLVKLLARAIELNAASLALPMIGCGAGRLTPAAFLQEVELLATEWMCVPCPVTTITVVDFRMPPSFARRVRKEQRCSEHLSLPRFEGTTLAKYLDTLASATATAFLQGFARLESKLEPREGDQPVTVARPLPPQDMVAMTERALRRDLLPDEGMLLQTARKYRNQFAHLGDETHDLDFLLTANRVASGFYDLLAELGVHRRSEPPYLNRLTPTSACGATPGFIAPVVAASAAAIAGAIRTAAASRAGAGSGSFSLKEQLASQDGPVRRLKTLLQSQMDPDDLRALRQRLIEKDGYAGDDDAILLEFCVRESPPEVLHELSRGRRLVVLEKLGGADAPAARETDEAILELLGFTVRPRPRGIVDIHRLVTLEVDRIKHADTRVEVLGAATAIASELERALIILLRFIQRIDDSGQLVAEVLRQKGTLDGQSQKIEKMSMGNLFAVLDGLVKALEKVEQHDDRQTRENQYLLAVRNSQLVHTARDLSMKRNRVIHFDKELDLAPAAPSRPDPALRKAALEFGEHALRLLDVLCESEERLFPQIVRIEEIKTDSWGRRVIVAENDEGRREKIFTRQDLKPGLSYYMVPFNNPVRVDPLLVEAGNGIIGG
jgi:O-acetyl-ADP-ribose deacetylase (regulator of RNase III)